MTQAREGERRRAVLRRQDLRRSANRQEPAELLHSAKNLWDSTFKKDSERAIELVRKQNKLEKIKISSRII